MRQYHALLCGSRLHSDRPRADPGLRLTRRRSRPRGRVAAAEPAPTDEMTRTYGSRLRLAKRIGTRPKFWGSEWALTGRFGCASPRLSAEIRLCCSHFVPPAMRVLLG